MADIIESAKVAFSSRNYLLAAEVLERGLNELRRPHKEYFLLYAESLCRVNRIKEAIDIYSHITTSTNYHLKTDQLKYLTYAILENIVKISRRNNNNTSTSITSPDSLLCPACHDIIVHPITTNCGHTYCRQCVRENFQCSECDIKLFGQNCGGQDILVKKLTEKWWPNELKAAKSNEEAIGYLDANLFDEALRCCNESLEKGKNFIYIIYIFLFMKIKNRVGYCGFFFNHT